MKAAGREFLRDLKAALALGMPEALDVALLGLRNMPEVRGNQALDNARIEHLLLPAGKMLGDRRVPHAYLDSLSHDPLAAIRVLAAVAFMQRVCQEDLQSEMILFRLAGDARQEVRRGMALAGRQCAADNQIRPLALAVSWLPEPVDPKKSQVQAARRRATALEILVEFAPTAPQAALAAAKGLQRDLDSEVRTALVELLAAAGRSGQASEVFALLETWAAEPEPNDWVIGRTLSASWAANTPGRAAAILDGLEAKLGITSSITNARQALARKAEKTSG